MTFWVFIFLQFVLRKKIFFAFALLVSSATLFANDKASVADALFEVEIPIVIAAPDELFALTDLVTNSTVLELLEETLDLLNTLLGTILPDEVIEVDLSAQGIEGGLLIVSVGADTGLWGVELNSIAFDAIASEEGATIAVDVEVIPEILTITFDISVTGSN